MKTAIVYASTHHGNTKKLVDAIASKHEVTLIDATTTQEADLSGYDLIGFASGIYAGNYHQSVLKFAANNLPAGKKVFYITTSAMSKPYIKSIQKAIQDVDKQEVGNYYCEGYNTFGPFKLVGGTGKGHPDEEDLANVVKFYEGILEG
ncbi:MAG: flavodoxin family protein [Lachnospiraceae bacterium]|nr:flavodoxin family protein [Lachnospiraceae bacterium]